MNELDALELILTELEEATPLPAYTKDTERDHKNEVIIIDNWNSNRVVRTNKPNRGPLVDENGDIDRIELQFYHTMRVDITINSDDEQAGMEYREDILDHFRPYEYSVTSLHEDLVTFEVGDGGPRSTITTSPELRLFKFVQALEFEFVDRVFIEDFETLEAIEDEYTIN